MWTVFCCRFSAIPKIDTRMRFLNTINNNLSWRNAKMRSFFCITFNKTAKKKFVSKRKSEWNKHSIWYVKRLAWGWVEEWVQVLHLAGFVHFYESIIIHVSNNQTDAWIHFLSHSNRIKSRWLLPLTGITLGDGWNERLHGNKHVDNRNCNELKMAHSIPCWTFEYFFFPQHVVCAYYAKSGCNLYAATAADILFYYQVMLSHCYLFRIIADKLILDTIMIILASKLLENKYL